MAIVNGDVANSGSTPLGAEDLIAQHQAGVWRYLRALGCDCALADDLTQETFLAVIRKPFEQINSMATMAYLRRVAYHLLISYRRRSGKMMVTDQAEHFETEWVRWAGFDGGETALEILGDCFKRLTQRAQLALQLRFRDGAGREEIAQTLAITQHGAKNLMQRAKLQLRDCVESKLS